MKRILLFAGIALAELSVAQIGTIFEADKNCEVQSSGSQVFYHRCEEKVAPPVLQPNPVADLDLQSALRKLPYVRVLQANYTCRSLRPINIDWTIEDQAGGSLGVSTSDEPSLQVRLVEELQSQPLSFTVHYPNKDNIQRVYPGCQATVDVHFKHIETKALTSYLQSQTLLKKMFAKAFAAITPDSDFVALNSSLDDSLLILEFLLDFSDEISRLQIETLIADLGDAKDKISVECEAGSSAALCTQAMALARQEIASEVDVVNENLAEIDSFVNREINRLRANIAATSVVAELTLAMNSHGRVVTGGE